MAELTKILTKADNLAQFLKNCQNFDVNFIMSSVSTVVAPTSSIIASTTNPSTAGRADGGLAQNQNSSQTVVTGQAAAVVHLSAKSKERAASSGEQRQTDAGFEKQGLKGRNEQKKDQESGEKNSGSLSVAA